MATQKKDTLAWIISNQGEQLVELCESLSDLGSLTVALGAPHQGELLREVVPRLLVHHNATREIFQGRGWAEYDTRITSFVFQHLAAVQEWVAFEKDGRGPADAWVADEIKELKKLQLDSERNALRYAGSKWATTHDPAMHEARIEAARERGFVTEPTDPHRAGVLSRLLDSIYVHGAMHVPPVTGYAAEYSSRGNAKETVVMLSLGNTDGQRVLFVCASCESNICEPGCWCAGHEMYSVHALAPSATGVEWVRVLTFDYSSGEAGGMGGGFCALTEGDAARLSTLLGIAPSDLGAAVRLVVLAANVKKRGRAQWANVEKAHVGFGVDGYDSEEDGGFGREFPNTDNVRSDDYRVRRCCGAGAVAKFPNIGSNDHTAPLFEPAMMMSGGESPRGILKKLKRNLSGNLHSSSFETLPRLVGELRRSKYFVEIKNQIIESRYKKRLAQYEKDVEKYPESYCEEDRPERQTFPYYIS